MTIKYIYLKNGRHGRDIRYNYYDTYDNRAKAAKIGKYYQKKNRSRYFILKVDQGFLFPETKYRLYLTRVMKLW